MKNLCFPQLHSYIFYTSRKLAMFSKTVQFIAHDWPESECRCWQHPLALCGMVVDAVQCAYYAFRSKAAMMPCMMQRGRVPPPPRIPYILFIYSSTYVSIYLYLLETVSYCAALAGRGLFV